MNHEDEVFLDIRKIEEKDNRLLEMCRYYDINGKRLDWNNEFVKSVVIQYLEKNSISGRQSILMKSVKNTIGYRKAKEGLSPPYTGGLTYKQLEDTVLQMGYDNNHTNAEVDPVEESGFIRYISYNAFNYLHSSITRSIPSPINY